MSIVRSKRSKDEINLKYIWHLRLDQIGEEKINRLVNEDLLDSFSDESYPVCESYLQEKIIKLYFAGHGERTTEVFSLVHIDVCGPFDMLVRGVHNGALDLYFCFST